MDEKPKAYASQNLQTFPNFMLHTSTKSESCSVPSLGLHLLPHF